MSVTIKYKRVFKHKLGCVLFYILSNFSSHCQNHVGMDLNIKSPQVVDFIKFGNVSTKTHLGLLDLKIPLLKVNSGSFSENIYLSYNSAGFMPAKRDGIVGLGWHLNAGGVITRTVRGKPDEHMGGVSHNRNGYPVDGFYYGARRFPMSENEVFEFSDDTGYAEFDEVWRRKHPEADADDSFESQPDIFRFNFHGISGSFFFNNSGEVEIIANQPVNIQIDLSNFKEQTKRNKSVPLFSEIVLILDNGYTYFFGGDQQNVEFTIPVKFHDDSANEYLVPSAVINTWNLTKVVDPSGNEMIYTYMGVMENSYGEPEDEFTQYGEGYYDDFHSANRDGEFRPIVINMHLNKYKRTIKETTTFFGNTYVSYEGGSEYDFESFEISKMSYLTSISTDEFFIEFDYQEKDNLFYESLDDSLYNFKDLQLEEIYFSSKEKSSLNGKILENEITEFQLEYETFGNLSFLESIELGDDKSYTMGYNIPSNLPDPETHSIDHWGYWKGGNSKTSELIPRFHINPRTGNRNYDHPGNIDYREPSGNPSAGLLRTITYPTSGSSYFFYEAHDYSKRIDRMIENGFLPKLYNLNTNKRAGGARIREIRDFDGEKYTNERNFYYVNDYVGTTACDTNPTPTLSSGTLLDWPRYSYFFTYNEGGSTVTQEFVSAHTSFNRNSYDGFHIMYSEVTEVFDDGGFTVHKFTDYDSHPDIKDFYDMDVEDQLDGFSTGGVDNVELHKNFAGQTLNDISIERGKLTLKTHYNKVCKRVFEERYEYNTNSNRYDNFVAQIHPTGGFWVQATKKYTYPNFITQKITKRYSPTSGDALTKQSRYEYNYEYNKLILEEQEVSNGDVLKKEYKYPFDLKCASGSTYRNKYWQMDDANVILPIEITNKLNDHVVNATVNNYELSGKKMLLRQVKSYNPTSFDKEYNSIRIKDNSCELEEEDDLKNEIIVDAHSNSGKIVQYRIKEGKSIVSLWDKNHQHLVAKIENATLDKLNAVTGISTNELKDFDETNLERINALRAQKPEWMITTYTHIPMIGVESITDPRGQTTTYHYDDFNRLQYIKDHDGNIIEAYDYNYKK